MLKRILCIAAVILLTRPGEAQPVPAISIVAAENFYGDVAQQIAGPSAAVTSILSNPDEGAASAQSRELTR